MLYLVEFLLVGLGVASAYRSKFEGGNSIDRPTSQDASISNIFKRLKRAAPDILNIGDSDLNFEYGDSGVSDVTQNVFNQGDGDIFESYGDCSRSRIMTSVKNLGSGDIHLVYKNRPQWSNASTADVPSNANNYGEWPQTIRSLGSGDTDVVYGNCRSSRVTQNVNLLGTGDIRIEYGKSTTSEVDHDILIAGDGDVYLEYDICYAPTSNVRSNANSGEELAHSIVIVGTGRLYTKCGNRRANRVSN